MRELIHTNWYLKISKKKKNLLILFSFNKMVKKITGKKKTKKIMKINFARK